MTLNNEDFLTYKADFKASDSRSYIEFIKRTVKGFEPTRYQVNMSVKINKEKIDDEKTAAQKARDLANAINDKAMATYAGQAAVTFKNAILACMAEINNQIVIKDWKVMWVKNAGIYRSMLEELRIFTKQPKYYSPSKVIVDDEPDGDMITNPLEGVKIVLTHDRAKMEQEEQDDFNNTIDSDDETATKDDWAIS